MCGHPPGAALRQATYKFLHNVKRSGAKYLLIASYVDSAQANRDIVAGAARGGGVMLGSGGSCSVGGTTMQSMSETRLLGPAATIASALCTD